MELHRQINFEGKTLHYRDEGRGNQHVLVLIHGFLQNLDVWSTYTLSYMRNMRVISVDLPGHGYSSTYGDTHTMEFMAKAVKNILDDAGVSQCVMVGHSLGGYVALEFAENYPYMLKGLGLLHSHAMPDPPEKKNHRMEVCRQVEKNRPGYIVDFIPRLFYEGNRFALEQEIKDLRDQCLETQTDGIIATQRGMAQRKSHIDLLEKIKVPVMFIIGKNDPRFDFELAITEAMLPEISDVLILNHVGHMAHIEAKDRVKNKIRSFVESCYN